MRRVILFCILFTLFSFGAAGQAEDAFTCPADFAGYLPPRLVVNERARVTLGFPLNLRPQPTTDLARIEVIREGENVQVVDGPRCNQGFVWWQVALDDLRGWVAEGSGSDYFIEPRGQLIVVKGGDGITRRYVRDAEGNRELEGCMRPPEDYTRVQEGYATLNTRTAFMLDQAQRIYDANGGIVNFRQAITQGSYNAGGVTASFGTHDGGGAVDISVRNVTDWSVLTTEIEPMVEALRTAGFAAWLRATNDLYANSPIHIHAIAIGDADLSPAAQEQLDGQYGYFYGYDGLPRENEIPVLERHGGPILCNWMRDLGYEDAQATTEAAEVYYASALNYYTLEEYTRAAQHIAAALAQEPTNADYLALRADIASAQ
ncbi:MAG: hypothetical protein OHK0046_35850 [Anaerolineae bacterium]